ARRQLPAQDLFIGISFAGSRRGLFSSPSQWCVFAFGLHSPSAQSSQVSFARKSVTSKKAGTVNPSQARQTPRPLRSPKNLRAPAQRKQPANQRRSVERLRRQKKRPRPFREQS